MNRGITLYGGFDMSDASGTAPLPLLTIAIPTFNRHETLAILLRALEPQVAMFRQVEVLVSDNCSADATPAVVEDFQARFAATGGSLRSQRHSENVGSDANFVSLFHASRGRFFWMCSDDDIIVAGGLARVIPHLTAAQEPNLLYATGYGFHSDPVSERQGDALHRRFHTFRDSRMFARNVNITFTFISGIIIHRERLQSIPHEDPAAFIGTNLVQLSWSLPLLLAPGCSVIVWERLIACRIGQAHGYSLGKVFGEQLVSVTKRLLPHRPDLVEEILNPTVRRWFPSMLIDIRSNNNTGLELESAPTRLRNAFGDNFRYWLFTWPVLRLPLPLARLWQKVGAVISKLIYVAQVPDFWRKQT